MSLDWSIENVADHETVCFEEREGGRYLNPITNALIWSTLGIGIGEITESNWTEFAWRLDLWQRNVAPLLTEWGEDDERPKPRYITSDEVRQHIGLHTNVFPKVPQATWLKRTFEQHRKDFERNARVQVEKVTA